MPAIVEILQRRIQEKLRSIAEYEAAKVKLKEEWDALQYMADEDQVALAELRQKLAQVGGSEGGPAAVAAPRHPLEQPQRMPVQSPAALVPVQPQMPLPDRGAPVRPTLAYGVDATSDQSVLGGHAPVDHSMQDVHGPLKIEGNLATEDV